MIAILDDRGSGVYFGITDDHVFRQVLNRLDTYICLVTEHDSALAMMTYDDLEDGEIYTLVNSPLRIWDRRRNVENFARERNRAFELMVRVTSLMSL